MVDAAQCWFLDVEIRFFRTVDIEPSVGKQVLVVDTIVGDHGSFAIASILEVEWHGTRQWYDGEKYWSLGDTLWAELPEFWKGTSVG